MRENRVTVIQHFLVLVILFPLCYVSLRVAVIAMFSEFIWDDHLCRWIDDTFGIPVVHPDEAAGFWKRSFSGGSHSWLMDIITLLPTLWCVRFLTGAVEEIRYTHRVSWVYRVEILSRWIALSTGTQLIAPLVGVLFFHAIRFVIWEPLAAFISLSLSGFLFFWGWQYPNRRIRHVEQIYRFEKVKEH